MPTRRPTHVLTVSLLLVGAIIAGWLWVNRERMVPIAPKILLSWDGSTYALLDARHEPDVGMDLPPSGGLGVMDRLSGIQVIDNRFIVGRSEAGEYFLMSLRKLGPDEPGENTVRRFKTEPEWRAACRAEGLPDPALQPPAKLFRWW